MMIRRFPNETEPIDIANLVPESAILNIVNSQGKNIRSGGSTTFTWDVNPTGPTSGSDWHPNAPNMSFIYLIVPIQVNTNEWFFGGWYNCQVRYWIYLYTNDSGTLEGSVYASGYWVQGGLYTGGVASALKSKIPATIPAVNSIVSQALTLANAAAPNGYDLVYYLPGNGTSGNTFDGVRIVGVKRGN